MLYETINGLNRDILLGIFDCYRLDEEKSWNFRLGWRNLSHVCQRWRHLIHESAFFLNMHILCTNGTPLLETLDHLPPLPLFIKYKHKRMTTTEPDKSGIYHAIRLRDRLRRIKLQLPSSLLYDVLMLMDKPFPILQRLSLLSTDDNITLLAIPKTFLAPNLRHLALSSIRLPKRLRFLSSTTSLVTLELTDIGASGYFTPRLLVARLQPLLQLEDLFIGFSTPIPRPGAERELLEKQGTPVTLPNLLCLTFRGVSAYLESLVAQIRTPLLEQLIITFFNQLVFALPYLSRFVNGTEQLILPTARVLFDYDKFSITLRHHGMLNDDGHFILNVMCKPLDWQIDCAAQICRALMPVLFGVEELRLDFYLSIMPIEWQNNGIDDTTWHELLRTFIGAKDLHVCRSLSGELTRALQVDEIASDPGLLPGLQKLQLPGIYDEKSLALFIDARQVAGRPVHLISSRYVYHRPSFASSSSSSSGSSGVIPLGRTISPSSCPDIIVQAPSRSMSQTPPTQPF